MIVGLGNPGIQYRLSRHNIGFQVVDRFSQRYQIPIQIRRFQSIYGIGNIDSQPLLLGKPLTYMNRSGEAIKKMVDFFQFRVRDLVVVHDDLDLPFGRLRFKQKGGDGGHQGVRSIIEAIGENNFLRLKIGIGRPPLWMDPATYVLETFNPIEQSQLEKIISQATESLRVYLLDGLERAMNQFQKKDLRNIDQ